MTPELLSLAASRDMCRVELGDTSRTTSLETSCASTRATAADREPSILEPRHVALPGLRPVCAFCEGPIPRDARRDARFCGKRCRQAHWRFRGPITRRASTSDVSRTAGAPRRMAYADPPYPGFSARYYGEHPDFAGEVDHAALIERLCDEFPDGWALSTSSKTLQDVLALCPPDVRIGAWTKPTPPHGTMRARCAWEPVIFRGGRPRRRDATPLLDWCHAAPMRSYPGAVVGTKPPAFCAWVFACLGLLRSDTLLDLYPGSGAVGHAWSIYRDELGDGNVARLAETHDVSRSVAPPAGGATRRVPHEGGTTL